MRQNIYPYLMAWALSDDCGRVDREGAHSLPQLGGRGFHLRYSVTITYIMMQPIRSSLKIVIFHILDEWSLIIYFHKIHIFTILKIWLHWLKYYRHVYYYIYKINRLNNFFTADTSILFKIPFCLKLGDEFEFFGCWERSEEKFSKRRGKERN